MPRGRSKEFRKKESLIRENDDDFNTMSVIRESYREDSYSSRSEAIDTYDSKIEDDLKESFEKSSYGEDSHKENESIDTEIPEVEDVSDSFNAEIEDYRKLITEEEAKSPENIDRIRDLPKKLTSKIKKKVGFLAD